MSSAVGDGWDLLVGVSMILVAGLGALSYPAMGGSEYTGPVQIVVYFVFGMSFLAVRWSETVRNLIGPILEQRGFVVLGMVGVATVTALLLGQATHGFLLVMVFLLLVAVCRITYDRFVSG